MQIVSNRYEAECWFLDNSSGSVLCVREDGQQQEVSSYPDAKAFFAHKAKDIVAVGGVMLRRHGDYAVVEVEIDGRWVEVIREHVETNFSHIAEPEGVRQAVAGRATVEAI